MQTFKIKPVKGMTIINPATMRPLPDEGADVPRNTFWLRRLQDEEIEIVQEKPAKNAKNAKPAS